MTPRIFITGASRGLGLELVRQYVAEGARVFAAARNPNAGELLRLAESHPQSLSLLPLEVTSEEQLAAAVATVRAQTEALDMVINNAGMNQRGLSLGEQRKITQGRLFPKEVIIAARDDLKAVEAVGK